MYGGLRPAVLVPRGARGGRRVVVITVIAALYASTLCIPM